MADMKRDYLRKFARLGARARLDELRQEEAAIRRAFPDLFSRGAAAASASASEAPRRRRRSRMSAAARKAVSERMRKYWAERRKAKGKNK